MPNRISYFELLRLISEMKVNDNVKVGRKIADIVEDNRSRSKKGVQKTKKERNNVFVTF